MEGEWRGTAHPPSVSFFLFLTYMLRGAHCSLKTVSSSCAAMYGSTGRRFAVYPVPRCRGFSRITNFLE